MQRSEMSRPIPCYGSTKNCTQSDYADRGSADECAVLIERGSTKGDIRSIPRHPSDDQPPSVWEWLSAVLFSAVYVINSSATLSLGFTYRPINTTWSAATFTLFFLSWCVQLVVGVTSIVVGGRNNRQKTVGVIASCIGLYVVFERFDCLLGRCGFYRDERKKESPRLRRVCDFMCRSVFMVVLRTFPQLLLQIYITGVRNIAGVDAIVSVVTSLLLLAVSHATHYHRTDNNNTNNSTKRFFANPAWETRFQKFHDFFRGNTGYHVAVRSVDILDCSSGFADIREKYTGMLNCLIGAPYALLLHTTFVATLGLFIAVHQVHGCWALCIWFALHVGEVRRLRRCRGTPGERRSYITFATFNRFVLNVVYCVVINALLSRWFVAMVTTVDAHARDSSPGFLGVPSFVWPDTVASLRSWEHQPDGGEFSDEWKFCNVTTSGSSGLPGGIVGMSDDVVGYCVSDFYVHMYRVVMMSSFVIPGYDFFLMSLL